MENFETKRIVTAFDSIWDTWWPALEGLDSAQLEQEIVGSFPTILKTVQHMVWAEWAWQSRMEKCEIPTAFSGEMSLPEIQTSWNTLREQRIKLLEQIDPIAPFTYTRGGVEVTIKYWEGFVHMTSHAHFHRGQLAMQFRQLELTPPSAHAVGFFMKA